MMRRKAKGHRARIAATLERLEPYLVEAGADPDEIEVHNHEGRDSCHDVEIQGKRLCIYNYMTLRLYFDGGERYDLLAGVLDLGDGTKAFVRLPDWLRHVMRKTRP